MEKGYQPEKSHPFQEMPPTALVHGEWWFKNTSLVGKKHPLFPQGGPPTSYKWSYNPYKWPYKWVTGVRTLLVEVIIPFIASRGPPCTICQDFFVLTQGTSKQHWPHQHKPTSHRWQEASQETQEVEVDQTLPYGTQHDFRYNQRSITSGLEN